MIALVLVLAAVQAAISAKAYVATSKIIIMANADCQQNKSFFDKEKSDYPLRHYGMIQCSASFSTLNSAEVRWFRDSIVLMGS